jgi:hypothetical protein
MRIVAQNMPIALQVKFEGLPLVLEFDKGGGSNDGGGNIDLFKFRIILMLDLKIT